MSLHGSFSLPAGRICTLEGAGFASDYAALLLDTLGVQVRRQPGRDDLHPAVAWANSGAMALTGHADGSSQMCPVPLASCIDGVRAAFAALAGNALSLPGAEVLGERAALSGLQRNGAIAPGGVCRLLRAADGWLAVNLTRDDDWQLLPAWLECPVDATWDAVAGQLATRALSTLVERGRLLGLAVAAAVSPQVQNLPLPWQVVMQTGVPRTTQGRASPLVVDLSALWAGPLCSHLLQLAGARVVKVESLQRPDGARLGPAEFYDLINHGKASVALDFSTAQGIGQLRTLLEHADIVIEASRPRALHQLGIFAEELVATKPGMTWISITGYGRTVPQMDWIAYGDDAGVAAGLSGLLLELTGDALFCGDAIADPLTGWHAALAALVSHQNGGGRLISLALCDVVGHCLNFKLPASADALHQRWRDWSAHVIDIEAALPRARLPAGKASALGADTQSILTALRIP
ncbi:MAG TPA: CoA transferase [Rhodocyclaceae bacterium]|nr:CoA transferase [Rhodocyclaceae bacterium]